MTSILIQNTKTKILLISIESANDTFSLENRGDIKYLMQSNSTNQSRIILDDITEIVKGFTEVTILGRFEELNNTDLNQIVHTIKSQATENYLEREIVLYRNYYSDEQLNVFVNSTDSLISAIRKEQNELIDFKSYLVISVK